MDLRIRLTFLTKCVKLVRTLKSTLPVHDIFIFVYSPSRLHKKLSNVPFKELNALWIQTMYRLYDEVLMHSDLFFSNELIYSCMWRCSRSRAEAINKGSEAEGSKQK